MPLSDSETIFLNVDLDIYSKSNLEPLVVALEGRVAVLYLGKPRRMYEAHLEISGMAKSADQVIRTFARLIDSLPADARRHWNGAHRRDFSVGIEAGMRPHALDFAIESKTVAAVGALNARIVFTIYAPMKPARSALKK